MNLFWEIVGYVAGICTATVFMPQTLKTIREKNVKGLSLFSYTIYIIGMIAWTAYGFYLHSLQMIIFNSISLVFAVIIAYMIIKYGKSEK